MVKISTFDKKLLTTYSKQLFLKLNEEMLDIAQSKIFLKQGMATERDLSTSERINSVINALVLPTNSDAEMSFKVTMNMAIYNSRQVRRVSCAGLRLQTRNYERIIAILEMMKSSKELPMKKEPILQVGFQRHPDLNDEISIVINAILIMFSMYDVEKDTMSLLGMEMK